MSNVNTTGNDLEILWVEPGADGSNPDTDYRVPTAQELAATSHLHQQNLQKAQADIRPAGIENRPAFGVAAGRGVIIPSGLSPYAPGHPSLAPLAANVTVVLPALTDTVSSISRHDRLYLMAFGAIVTSDIDASINLSFEWRNQSNAIQTLTKENTRRIRTFWAIVWSQGAATTAGAVYSALTTAGSNKVFTASTSTSGIALGSTLRLYSLDPNLAATKTYTVVQDTVQMIDLCRVWRVQNFLQNGYLWNRTGEADFDANFHIQPTYQYVGEGWSDWDARTRETMRRIFLGLPLINTPTGDRVVQNLINGQVAGNLDAPGIATASPNGSTALSNGQRVSFSNQAITQKTYVLPVTTSNVGGSTQATVAFQGNSPAGAYFSQNIADHKVWRADGRDVTLDGTLVGLGGTGSLVWTTSSSVVAPGDVVYVQPGIYYPAGSGFAVSGEIERVFLDNTGSSVQINAANVREASTSDLDAYAAPASGETYFVVVGKERGALHYILKRITVTSTSGGVVAIPGTERGAIAFISGPGAPAGRIDRPVVSGLSNSTSYNLLVYYAPPGTDKWQFQFRVPRYAGTQEKTLLNGAIVATEPIAIAHCQGGGNGYFLSDAEWQYEAISFRLPANTLNAAKKHFLADYRIQFFDEVDIGASSYREVDLFAAAGLALPRVGQQLAAIDAASAQTKGLAIRLQNSASQVLGALKIPIRCSQVYQLVVVFSVVNGSSRRLVAVTLNEGNVDTPSSCAFNSDSPSFAAIDTFTIY